SAARDAKKHGQPAEACRGLQEAARLDPKLPSLSELLEAAECTEAGGDLLGAEASWAAARERAKHDEKPQSRARAEERGAAVQKRIAHLTLQLAPATPAGVEVLRDDVRLDAATLGRSTPSNPGEHLIVVKLAGHDDAKYPLKLAEGDVQSLAIAPGPSSAASATAVAAPLPASAPLPVVAPPLVTPAPPARAPSVQSWWSTPRKVGAIAGALGVVGVAGGTVLCLASDSGKADSRLALGGVSLAAGSVLLLSGIVLLASAPSDDPAQHAGLRVTPAFAVGPSAAVFGASGHF
ncbi:MAG TPA: hypothetical protein VEQ59_24650, partial [Polyangiaceae bacterium]|nr:hypothetical protein [Polyangiaceae bacterium]